MLAQKIKSLSHRLLPCLPPGFRLPFLAWIYSITGSEPELKWLHLIGPCKGLAIDVGANCGFYTLALARLYHEVIAFEPNKEIAALLVDAKLAGVKVIHSAVSSAPGVATLFIPRVDGVTLSGWASLDQGNCPGAMDFDRREIPLCTLDSFRFENVGFIKIDVEGHELSVIKGAAETIRRDKPAMLLEVREAQLPELRSLLSEWGYCETTLKKLGGPEGADGNYIFIPNGKKI